MNLFSYLPLLTHRRCAVFLFLSFLFILIFVLSLEYIGGYFVCSLCYKQRIGYYAGLLFMFLVFLFDYKLFSVFFLRFFFICTALCMLFTFSVALFHFFIELGWWFQSYDCQVVQSFSPEPDSLLESLRRSSQLPVSCKQVMLRILGLSLSGWNVLISFFFILVALCGSFLKRV